MVDRATGRRSSTMASYGSPGAASRSCSASAAAHSRVEDGAAARDLLRGRRAEERRAPSGSRPGSRTGRRCGSRRRGSRSDVGSVSTCRACAGVVASHGPLAAERDHARPRGRQNSAEPAAGRLDAVHVHHCARGHFRDVAEVSAARRGPDARRRRPELVGGALGLDGGADAVHHVVSPGWGGRCTPGSAYRGTTRSSSPVVMTGVGVRTPGRAVSRRSGRSAAGCAAASA